MERDLVARPKRSRWALLVAGVLLAAAGGVWWAWDADPTRGTIVLLVGLVLVVLGQLVSHRPGSLPERSVIVAAVIVTLYAGFEFWQAISTILSQGAAHAA